MIKKQNDKNSYSIQSKGSMDCLSRKLRDVPHISDKSEKNCEVIKKFQKLKPYLKLKFKCKPFIN